MSQFKFYNDMNSLLNLDGELKNQSKPRWQRKMENSMMNGSQINASKLSISYNNSYASALGGNTTMTGNTKTPNKSTVEGGAKKRTPNDKKSPGKNKRLNC